MRIEQAIYGGQDTGGYRFLARSGGFRDDWLTDAEQLCTGFGERPAGVACPLALFTLPLNSAHVAIVQVADQGRDDSGRPGALAFRLLVVPRRLYADLGGDPFFIADQYPPPWDDRGELPALEWTAGAPPQRTIDQIRAVLDVPISPTLLGGVQALLDGGKLVFQRPEPDMPLLRSLWALLPTASRSEMWPATFAFDNVHGFHVVVSPRTDVPGFEGYLPEEQAGDYPEGNYERALQVAAEESDQADLDALFSRRSRAQMIRLGLLMLGGFAVAALFVARPPSTPLPTGTSPKETPKTSKGAPTEPPLQLPRADAYPRLDPAECTLLAERLRHLGARIGVTLPAGNSTRDVAESLARLDARLDELAPRKGRDPGKLADLGPPQRQLRALLWKHGVPDYAEQGLNTLELLERLEQQLLRAGLIQGVKS
jgi:hypothetical protein